MTQAQQQFIDKEAMDNTTWAAQQILEHLKPSDRYQIFWALRKLDKVLYKSWAKDLSLNELMDAVKMINEIK